MSAVWSYRIAAIVLVLFGALHTVGFLSFKAPTAEGLAVWDSMNHVRFQVRGHSYSYGAFYVAFGLANSVCMFFSAFVAWHLSGLTIKAPQAIGALGWVFFAAQLAGLALSWIYFGPPQIIFSGAVAACLGWAAFQASRAR